MAARAVAAPGNFSLSTLLRRTVPSFKYELPQNTHLAGLDITPTHISLSLSNRSQDTAVPFGILARTPKPSADALILQSALQHARNLDPICDLDVSGLVVGVAPGGWSVDPTYIEQLLVGSDEAGGLFPGLAAVLFYSEAHVVARALHAYDDFVQAAHLLPPNLESRKVKRFAAAIDPKGPPEDLQTGPAATARISASEILQAVLDDMKRQG